MPYPAREEIDVADCKDTETPLLRNSVGAGARCASLSGTRWLAVSAMMRDRDLGGSGVRCSTPEDRTRHGCAFASVCATVTAASPRSKLSTCRSCQWRSCVDIRWRQKPPSLWRLPVQQNLIGWRMMLHPKHYLSFAQRTAARQCG